MRRAGVVVAAIVALLAALAGCGIGAEPEANRIDPTNVPFGLLDAGPTTTLVDQGQDATIYLVASDRLVPIGRTVPDGSTLADLVELVVAGPTSTERALGATTAVPAGTVASVTQDDDLAEVELTTAFGEVRSEDQLLAIGQIVYTLTEAPGVTSVQFSLAGDPIGIPAADGTQRDGPVSRRDLGSVAPS
ncbi:MAG: GerMN domain-containing protein [Acidimicrobiales bacterium]